MISSLLKFDRPARMVATITTSLVPFLVVGGLLYAAFFVKASAVVASVKPPAIERRDSFLGVALPAPDVIWAAGANGKIVRSDDGGRQWAAQRVPTTENLQGIAAWSGEQAVAVGGDGVVLRTDDAGMTWTAVEAPKSAVANKLLNVRSAGDGIAWAVGEMGALLHSADFGKSWGRALPEKDQAWNDVSFAGAHGIVVGEFGQIMITDDAGKTWRGVKSGVPSSLMSVYLRDGAHAVAVGLSGVVLVSYDGGAQWAAVPPQTREHLNNVHWDGQRWLVVGDKGVLLTADAAATSWNVGRVSEGNLGWNTQILPVAANGAAKATAATPEPRSYLLAGASLSRLSGVPGGQHVVFGRNAD